MNKNKINNIEDYKNIYDYSIKNNDEFWSKKAERISWHKKW